MSSQPFCQQSDFYALSEVHWFLCGCLWALSLIQQHSTEVAAVAGVPAHRTLRLEKGDLFGNHLCLILSFPGVLQGPLAVWGFPRLRQVLVSLSQPFLCLQTLFPAQTLVFHLQRGQSQTRHPIIKIMVRFLRFMRLHFQSSLLQRWRRISSDSFQNRNNNILILHW